MFIISSTKCLGRLFLGRPRPSLRCFASVPFAGPGEERRKYDCLFLDAAGTLLSPAQPVAYVYKEFAAKCGIELKPEEVLERYRSAFQARPNKNVWSESSLRYVGDARDFWRGIVTRATGSSDEVLFESLYAYYEKAEAWSVMEGAQDALQRLKDEGIKLVVVSNFDTRLRPLLHNMKLDSLFDHVVVSAEVGAEKPNPVIFEAAIKLTGMQPWQVVHVGDDRRNDIWGARDAGIDAWLWGSDVKTYKEIADRVLSETVHVPLDDRKPVEPGPQNPSVKN